MSKQTVRHDFNPANPPPLTDAEKKELIAIAALPDRGIDFSDIPPLTERFWLNSRRNPLGLVSTATMVRIDPDVSAWLKADGGDLEKRINVILRREMIRTDGN